MEGKLCYPALPCKLAAVVIHRMLWCKGCISLRCTCMQAAVMIHRMLWWKKGVLSCAAMQARCVIHRMLWWRGRCAIPALPCMLAAVVIHRMLWWKKVCYPCAAMHTRSSVMIHQECSGGRGVLPAAMQARCCCDSQNALVEEGCAILRCHASSLLL
jgi:hypothetical protein